MRPLLLSVMCLFFLGPVVAQSDACTPFFVFKEGTNWEMESYNKRDKLQSKMRYKIISVSKEGGKVTAEVSSQVYDKKGKLQFELDYAVSCEEGVYSVDLSSVLSPEITKGFEGMEMEIDGQELQLPADLKKGETLPAADTKITVTSSGIQIMSTTVRMEDRQVTDEKNVTVPAGTFNAFEITSDQFVKAGFISREYKMVDYYAPGVGMVKSETYDKNGKKQSYMILTQFEKGI